MPTDWVPKYCVPRKERSCSKVLPVDPATTRLEVKWNDKGDDTKLDPFSISFSKSWFVISRLESVLKEVLFVCGTSFAASWAVDHIQHVWFSQVYIGAQSQKTTSSMYEIKHWLKALNLNKYILSLGSTNKKTGWIGILNFHLSIARLEPSKRTTSTDFQYKLKKKKQRKEWKIQFYHYKAHYFSNF